MLKALIVDDEATARARTEVPARQLGQTGGRRRGGDVREAI